MGGDPAVAIVANFESIRDYCFAWVVARVQERFARWHNKSHLLLESASFRLQHVLLVAKGSLRFDEKADDFLEDNDKVRRWKSER